MRCAILLQALLIAAYASGQAQDHLAARHELINAHFNSNAHAEVVKEINVQLGEVDGSPWQDSLYTYVYKLGRALARTQGPEAAISAAADVVDRIKRSKTKAQFEVKALHALGELNYELGRMQDYFQLDSLALAIARNKASAVPPQVLAEAFYVMGLCRTDLDRHAEAEPDFLETIRICEKDRSISRILLAKAYSALGGVLRRLGRPVEAERNFKLGTAALSGDTSIQALSMKATILGNTGILVQNIGDLPRSKDYYHQSLAVLNSVIEKGSDPKKKEEDIMNRSRIYVNLASVYFAMMDMQRVREWLHLAMQDRKSVMGEGHPDLVRLNEAFGEMEAMAGDLQKAADLFGAQLRNIESNLGRNNDAYIRMGAKLARIHWKMGEYARSDSLYDLVIPASIQHRPIAYDLELAIALADRADSRSSQGRYHEAIADLEICRRMRLAAEGPEYSKIAETEVSLSNNALLAGDPATAVMYADSALSRLADRIATYERSFTPVAFRNPHLLADAVYAKVSAERALRTAGKIDPRWSELIDLAIRSLQRNMASVSGEGPRLQLIATQEKFFELALDLAFAGYEASPGNATMQRFLDLAEADRSMLLKSRLNDLISMRYKGIPERVLAREQELIADLRKASGDREAMDHLVSIEHAYAAFLDSLDRDHPNYFQLRYGTPKAPLEELRKRILAPDRAMIAYTVTSSNVYMLVVRTDTAAILRVPSAGLADLVHGLNKAVAGRDAPAYLSASYELFARVFAPAVPLLKNEGLVIIPDGPLHQLNFELLVDAPISDEEFVPHLLLQRYSIGHLLSATTALQFHDLKRQRSPEALVLAPGFSETMKERYLSKVTDRAAIDHGFLGYVRQPFALAAAQRIGDLLSARTLFGEEASERQFRTMAPRYDILHLGTHAEVNDRMPMFSRLVLGKDGAGNDADSDGYLHAHEIYGLDLDAQLAVLTACETGSGHDVRGEGVRSIGHGFAYAGCPSLVMSLWNIDEKVSSEIIGRFYEHLADGMTKDRALRQAKLDHLANAQDELVLPYYWAGMVLVGDIEALDLARPWYTRSIWIIAGLLIIIAISWYFLRRRIS